MPEYLTRRLIATDSMRHDGRELKPGDEFEASEVDARYLVGQMRAREVLVKVARVVAPEPRPVETKTHSDGTAVTGTPPLPEQSPAQQDADSDAEQPAEDGAMTTADAGEPATPRGRRASPSTNHANTGTRRRT